MSLFTIILSALILFVSPSHAIDCKQEPNLLGEYKEETRTIHLCEDNILNSQYSIEQIRNHENIHKLQHHFRGDKTFLPDSILTPLVRQFIPSEEVLFVLLEYENSNVELEARLLDNIPSFIINIIITLFHL